MRLKRSDRLLAGIFIAALVLILCTIILRFGTRVILIRKLGMDNQFTQLVMFGNGELIVADWDQEEEGADTVDWKMEYPFEGKDESQQEEPQNIAAPSLKDRCMAVIAKAEESITKYTNENLMFYQKLVEFAGKYEDSIGWNLGSFAEYNAVVSMDDGYLTRYLEPLDMTECAESVAGLKDCCDRVGTEFAYVQIPYKVSKYEDTEVSGKLDFSNQNADSLLELLAQAGIKTYDLREEIVADGLSHHQLYYRTDHHWKGETGLWASQKLLNYLKTDYGYDVSPEVLNTELFRKEEYPDHLLGSQGKKVTLAQTEPDDFTMLFPTYENTLHLEIPNLEIDEVGDFSITYNMEQVEGIDYYHKNPYESYGYGNRPLIRIHNEDRTDGTKVLLIRDSFCDSVVPFMALGCETMEALDLRRFTGSVETYIGESKPDIVIVLYNPDVFAGEIDYSENISVWDFR